MSEKTKIRLYTDKQIKFYMKCYDYNFVISLDRLYKHKSEDYHIPEFIDYYDDKMLKELSDFITQVTGTKTEIGAIFAQISEYNGHTYYIAVGTQKY